MKTLPPNRADASHELRTPPLAAMQTIIAVTRSQKRNAKDYEQALDDLGEETSRLRSLTEDLLLLALGESSESVHRERVDLSSLLEDVVESLTPLADAKRLALECRIWLDNQNYVIAKPGYYVHEYIGILRIGWRGLSRGENLVL